MTWAKKPAIEGGYTACACCGPTRSVFPPNGEIAVGFGVACLLKDGRPVWDENEDPDNPMTGAQAEELAAADPDHDWQIQLVGPLREAVYQRHGPSAWVLIEEGQGFA